MLFLQIRHVWILFSFLVKTFEKAYFSQFIKKSYIFLRTKIEPYAECSVLSISR